MQSISSVSRWHHGLALSSCNTHFFRAECSTRVEFGQLHVDLVLRTVTRDGQAIHLTPTEYRMLGVLLAHAGCVLTHRQLLKAVWGPTHVEHTHYLRVLMAGLRRKLEAEPARPQHFLTESGVGYRLVL